MVEIGETFIGQRVVICMTYHYCAHRAVAAAQAKGDSLRLGTPMRSDQYVGRDGSARRM